MNVLITRLYHGRDATLGILQIEDIGHIPIYTLEEPWNENKRGISCIPAGNYKCKPHGWQGKFKQKDCWEIANVPDRSAILIHSGNTVKDIEGCILVGLSKGEIDGRPAVLQSRMAMDQLRAYLGQRPFDLEIV